MFGPARRSLALGLGLGAALMMVACSSDAPPAGTPDAGGADAPAPGDSGPGTDAPALDLAPPPADLPPPPPPPSDGGPGADLVIPVTTHTMSIGPLEVQPGEEFVRCVEVRVGNDADVWVRRISSAISDGSHHMILYRMPEGTRERVTPFNCRSFEPILSGGVPLYIAQTTKNALPFPENVALKFKAGAVVRLEAHYINANPQTAIMGMGVVNFDAVGAEAAYTEADLLFYGPYDIQIPPRVTDYYLPNYYGEPPSGIKVFGLTSHTHQLGVDFQIEKSVGGAPGELLHRNQNNWDNPPLELYPTPVEFNDGEGLRWTCGYTNPTDEQIGFGESAYDEMCFLWAYYYPSRGFQVCVPGAFGC